MAKKEEGIDFVMCRHCGAAISKITVPHLRRCGGGESVRAYRLKYPDAPVEARVKKRTEAQRQAQSEKLKARFQTAEGQATRQRISEAAKAMQAGEYGKAAAEHLRRITADPENRKEIGIRSKQAWATGQVREKQAAWREKHREEVEASAANARAHITCWEDPAHREKMSALAKERWKDGKYRTHLRAAIGRRWKKPEEREKHRIRSLEQWKDPQFRDAFTAFAKERWKDPAYRQLMSEHMKRRWRGAFRQVMAEVRARTVMPYKDTRIEVAMQGVLVQMGIPYQAHGCVPGCGSHQFDLVLEEPRVLVEVQGCWWHACATCDRVSDPHEAERRRARDARKRIQAKAAGWRLLEVWEHEFGDLGVVEQRVRAFLGM